MGGVVGDLQPQFLFQMSFSLVSCPGGSGKAISLLTLLPKHEERLTSQSQDGVFGSSHDSSGLWSAQCTQASLLALTVEHRGR